jgi:hypothetical protein
MKRSVFSRLDRGETGEGEDTLEECSTEIQRDGGSRDDSRCRKQDGAKEG